MSDHASGHRTTRLASLSIAAILAATPALAACGEETVHEKAYCTTQDGTVVDDSNCDDHDGHGGGVFPYWIWVMPSNSSYRPGQRIPASSGHHFRYNDAKSRANYGLPKTGRISSGKGGFGTTTTRTTSRGGGFGAAVGHVRARRLPRRRGGRHTAVAPRQHLPKVPDAGC